MTIAHRSSVARPCHNGGGKRRPGYLSIVLLSATALGASAAPNSEETSAAPEGVESVVVTARLRKEDAQSVPISMSVLSGDKLDLTNTFNLSQLTQMVPSTNFVSPNPRNTALTIRGLGSSVVAVSQANDGLEPGVGFYIDQVYHARPATAAFDLLDLERVEVLRGPQGTLFGKNTTAGAINITTRAPSFDREVRAEITGGNFGFIQSKFSATGGLVADQLAGRVSLVTNNRDGVLDNVNTGEELNDVNNLAARGQLLYHPRQDFSLRLSTDYSAIDTDCCTQVFFGVGKTLRPENRQYPALAAGQNYRPPSFDPYDRLTDIDSDLKVQTHEGGVAAIADWDLETVRLSSISAWRYWSWNAANDRDYIGLPIQTVQGIPSRQDQYSQELRIASSGRQAIEYTGGFYFFSQVITGNPQTGYGPLAAYWLLGDAPAVPANLLDGYRTDGHTRFASTSYALFGEAVWHALERLDVTGGFRYTLEDKEGKFNSQVSGGLITSDADLIKKRLSILRPQSYRADVTDGSASGRVVLSWHWNDKLMSYGSWALGQKSGGINMSGLPLTADNQPALTTAAIKPEEVITVEVGIKSRWFDDRLLVNFDVFHTDVYDFQANVVDTGPGALRGYLANVKKVRVQGAELDASLALTTNWRATFASAWTDSEYSSYRNAPCPLERIGGTSTVCDLSGRPLSNTPRWVFSGGTEYSHPMQIADVFGEAYARADFTVRSQVYGDPTNSRYTVIDGYGLLNVVAGFRPHGPWDVSLWVRNLLNDDYMQNLTVQAGNSGLIVGTPSDPRTYGITLRARF
jgi:iron complex outermembrane receptor protein